MAPVSTKARRPIREAFGSQSRDPMQGLMPARQHSISEPHPSPGLWQEQVGTVGTKEGDKRLARGGYRDGETMVTVPFLVGNRRETFCGSDFDFEHSEFKMQQHPLECWVCSMRQPSTCSFSTTCCKPLPHSK